MIKAIIVEDEVKGRQTLYNLLLKHCPFVEIATMVESVDEAVLAITNYKPDLVFLDIEMPGGSGFTLLEKIKNPDFEVIFTTAFDDYAIKAIKFSALDYLLKPIDVDDLVSAVNKVRIKRHTQCIFIYIACSL